MLSLRELFVMLPIQKQNQAEKDARASLEVIESEKVAIGWIKKSLLFLPLVITAFFIILWASYRSGFPLLTFLASLPNYQTWMDRHEDLAPILHNVRHEFYWDAQIPDWRENILIMNAPTDLESYIQLGNFYDGFPNIPNTHPITKQQHESIYQAVNTLPESILNLVQSRLVAIFWSHNIGGTAISYPVYNHHGKVVGGFIVLDMGLLKRPANDWATFKEQSPFLIKNIWPEVTLRPDHSNTMKEAIQFIILHEMGHILSFSREDLPHYELTDQLKDIGQYPFSRFSWTYTLKKGVASTKPFAHVHFYAANDQKKNEENMIKIYQDLSESNFPSLYGTVKYTEDFAESFAIFVHTKILESPYQVDIKNQRGEILYSYRSCIQTGKCKEKVEYIQNILTSIRQPASEKKVYLKSNKELIQN